MTYKTETYHEVCNHGEKHHEEVERYNAIELYCNKCADIIVAFPESKKEWQGSMSRILQAADMLKSVELDEPHDELWGGRIFGEQSKKALPF
jgi:hypothetical protein